MNSESVRIYLVAAMGANRVIGNGPNIPWKIPGEQKIFRRLTEGKVVVMGRKTFESIGKPLPNRHTLVISRQANYRATGCVVVSTLSLWHPNSAMNSTSRAELRYTLWHYLTPTACFYLRYIKPSRVTPSSQCSTKQNSSLSQPKPFKL